MKKSFSIFILLFLFVLVGSSVFARDVYRQTREKAFLYRYTENSLFSKNDKIKYSKYFSPVSRKSSKDSYCEAFFSGNLHQAWCKFQFDRLYRKYEQHKIRSVQRANGSHNGLLCSVSYYVQDEEISDARFNRLPYRAKGDNLKILEDVSLHYNPGVKGNVKDCLQDALNNLQKEYPNLDTNIEHYNFKTNAK